MYGTFNDCKARFERTADTTVVKSSPTLSTINFFIFRRTQDLRLTMHRLRIVRSFCLCLSLSLLSLDSMLLAVKEHGKTRDDKVNLSPAIVRVSVIAEDAVLRGWLVQLLTDEENLGVARARNKIKGRSALQRVASPAPVAGLRTRKINEVGVVIQPQRRFRLTREAWELLEFIVCYISHVIRADLYFRVL